MEAKFKFLYHLSSRYRRLDESDSDRGWGGGGGGTDLPIGLNLDVLSSSSSGSDDLGQEEPYLPKTLSLSQLLAANVSTHQSTADLSESLTSRIHEVLQCLFRAEGFISEDWVKPDAIVEPSFDKARASLTSLMARTRQNMVATITKNDNIDNAVALVDWRALEIVCQLAEKSLKLTKKVGELAVDQITPADAIQLAKVDIHRPLAKRQTPAQRREAIKSLGVEADAENI